MKTALTFPATAIDALRFNDRHKKDGWRVIGAASVPGEEVNAFYDGWANLPFIYEDDFLPKLSQLIEQEKICKVFTSHEVVKRYFLGVFPRQFPNVELEVAEQYRSDASFIQLVTESFSAYQKLASDLGVPDQITATEHLAVLSRAFQIRGESGVQKLSKLMAALGSAPKGDVVEIGVLSGRSAFVLGWSARRHSIGSVLCIDPWTVEEAMQHDAPTLLQQTSSEINFTDFFDEFRLNLLPTFYADLNYLRETANTVRERFVKDFQVGPTEFGATKYQGQIALLHIDGNHDYEVVSEDVSLWWQAVLPGGWIVVDDYEWPFGDGPKRAADELIAQHPEAFQQISLCDGALFLQRAA